MKWSAQGFYGNLGWKITFLKAVDKIVADGKLRPAKKNHWALDYTKQVALLGARNNLQSTFPMLTRARSQEIANL